MLSALIAVWSCLVDGPELLPERRERLLLLETLEPNTALKTAVWMGYGLGISAYACFALVTIHKEGVQTA